MTIKVNRNGRRELVERATIGKPGESGKFHDRVLYDFEAHRLFTVDLNSHICTTQEYTSPYVSGMIDPVGAASETTSGLANMPARLWTRDTVNGIAVKVAELPMPEGQGKSKFWVDEKYGFVVKLAMAMGTEPETTRFEIEEIGYAPSPASLFNIPQGCKAIGGTSNATGGHAEMTTEATLPARPGPPGPGRESHRRAPARGAGELRGYLSQPGCLDCGHYDQRTRRGVVPLSGGSGVQERSSGGDRSFHRGGHEGRRPGRHHPRHARRWPDIAHCRDGR